MVGVHCGVARFSTLFLEEMLEHEVLSASLGVPRSTVFCDVGYIQ
jgi:hypothetical protein